MTGSMFDQVYNQELLAGLTRRFGPFEHHQAELPVSTAIMLDMMEKMQVKGRRGEVVMVVPDEEGHIWLHTKDFYPAGVYRLMTGGLEPGEPPQQALLREVEEETGFKTEIDRCLAVITYALSGNYMRLPFVSYLFLTMPTAGRPQPIDPHEAITNFRAVPVEALPEVATKLRSLEGEFADWGIFRAIAHEVAWLNYKRQPGH